MQEEKAWKQSPEIMVGCDLIVGERREDWETQAFLELGLDSISLLH